MINFEVNSEMPYATDDLAGIGGKLRAKPEHFEVHEIPLYEALGEGEHLFVNVTKVGLTTKQVQNSLAKLFTVQDSQVGFAGLKDKNAVTSQTFSVFTGNQPLVLIDEAIVRIDDLPGLSVNWAKYHRNKLKTGHLLGNRFAIVVSEVDCEAGECMARCEAVAQSIIESGLPNYFGVQRFGVDGGNVAQGLGILQGRLRRNDKWLRKFLVGSVQSYLCNVYLAERLRSAMFDRLMLGDVAKKVDTGGMFEVEDVDSEQRRYEAHEISFTAPLFGPKMWPASGESGEFESSILKSASLSNDDFKRVRVSGTRRMGRLLVDVLRIEPHAEGVLIRFTLPKGAYATTVLREFMKSDIDALDEMGEADSE